ncbi:MAG: glucan biosynthesis protein [Beijerinckiaceae bacterium]
MPVQAIPVMDRRHFLETTAAVSAAALFCPSVGSISPATAQTQTGALTFLQAILQDGTKFDPAIVIEAARLLSKRVFSAPNVALPDPFNGLNQEAYLAIRHRPERQVWADENRAFTLEPLHRGFVYNTPVMISVVEEGMVHRVVYDAGRYTFGRLAAPAQLPDMGFSGFRILTTGENPREIASFQGGTFFKSLARGQNMGTVARALAIRTADGRGEEFPVFRAFWIERPAQDGSIIIHAVADSESATAAFRFVIRSHDVTIIDTEATVFARTALDSIGLCPMQATFLFAANKRRNVDDYRPSVHDVSGLQMLNGRGEWIWRPLNNPEQLQISSFMDDNPRGFGLVQRNRDFANYQDDDARFELRPSLWIEPIGDWGPGSVQLVEIPSDSEVNDNVIAFWRPRTPLAAGSETTLTYRQFWCWTPPEKSDLAAAVSFRIGRGSTGRRRKCLVEFAGDVFGQDAQPDMKLVLSASSGQITQSRLVVNAARKSARVHFEIDPGNENATELRLLIESNDKPLTETWLYRWTT